MRIREVVEEQEKMEKGCQHDGMAGIGGRERKGRESVDDGGDGRVR